ncbi:MAG: acyl-CoA thioesterase [Bacteroidetes bacterium]|nr:acyl-CoA thioesterase [Bacteroidota bacterium]
MFSFNYKLRVRYAETDRMGYVYYGNYATYFEVCRVEAIRSMGISYKQMEDDGIFLPVLEFSIKYYKPAFYDDELTIKTFIKEIPATRIFFDVETYNQQGILLNSAKVTLVFVSKETGKPVMAPDYFLERFKEHFK